MSKVLGLGNERPFPKLSGYLVPAGLLTRRYKDREGFEATDTCNLYPVTPNAP